MLADRQLYYRLVDDWAYLPAFLEHFEKEAAEAKGLLSMSGKLETISQKLPVEMDRRFTQLQILNATLEFFEKQLEKTRSLFYRKYLERYDRALTSRDVEKYVDGEDEVISLALIINEISLMRNIFISVTKAIDAKGFQINNITKLRTAGLEDATID